MASGNSISDDDIRPGRPAVKVGRSRVVLKKHYKTSHGSRIQNAVPVPNELATKSSAAGLQATPQNKRVTRRQTFFQKTTFRFLDLPFEIRLMIYGFCKPDFRSIDETIEAFEGPSCAVCGAGDDENLEDSYWDPDILGGLRGTPTVLLLNKQIYEEASAVIYRDSKLTITHHYDPFYRIQNFITPGALRKICHLEISCDAISDNALFVRLHDFHRIIFEVVTALVSWSDCSFGYALESLTINLPNRMITSHLDNCAKNTDCHFYKRTKCMITCLRLLNSPTIPKINIKGIWEAECMREAVREVTDAMSSDPATDPEKGNGLAVEKPGNQPSADISSGSNISEEDEAWYIYRTHQAQPPFKRKASPDFLSKRIFGRLLRYNHGSYPNDDRNGDSLMTRETDDGPKFSTSSEPHTEKKPVKSSRVILATNKANDSGRRGSPAFTLGNTAASSNEPDPSLSAPWDEFSALFYRLTRSIKTPKVRC